VYLHWRALMGFTDRETGLMRNDADSETATRESWDRFTAYARGRGIEMKSESRYGNAIPISVQQMAYIESILRLLPDSFLQTSYLKGVVLGASRGSAAMGSEFDQGRVKLFSGALAGPRRNLLGYLVHELGHSTAERYALNIDENRYGSHQAAMPPDSSISQAVRQKMHDSFNAIQRHVFALNWGYGDRTEYTSGSFNEFLAELHLVYVAAGPALRAHIEKLKSDPQTADIGKSYEFIYEEMKNRIFNGREYGPGGQIIDPSPVRPPPFHHKTTPPIGAVIPTIIVEPVAQELTPDPHQPLIIGRDHTDPAVGLVITDPTVSRRHCRIYKNEFNDWMLQVDSSNGVAVIDSATGQRTEIQAGQTHLIKQGDVLFIGQNNSYLFSPPL
ncbi:MAG: FHA domain-containing protein, partial [Deltaproteobacteria bacterium]|nr:FHA domain-containing protein [Deltaproteobacteria bacterium]